MFGYITINKEDLCKEDLDLYQSYYCGLCHVLKQDAGPKGQVLLTYDMTFLVVLLSGLYELENKTVSFRCKLHPQKKQTMRINEATEYAAAMNILLAWQKFADDWRDEKSPSKKAMMNIYQAQYKEAARRYPHQAKVIENCLKKLHHAEDTYETNADIVAGYTGEMMAEILAWRDDMWAQNLRTMGFYLGKFIYLMDAYEDVAKDRKKGNYNVLSQLQRENAKEFDEICRLMLVSLMGESARAFERLPIIEHSEVLRNVMYSGVWLKFRIHQTRLLKEQEKRLAAKKKKQAKIRKRKK